MKQNKKNKTNKMNDKKTFAVSIVFAVVRAINLVLLKPNHLGKWWRK